MKDYEWVECFPPIVSSKTKVIILGSVPGQESLRRGEYYAHPQNQFWILLSQVLPVPFDFFRLRWENKCRQLLDSKVGLWSAIAGCDRYRSSDSSIRNALPVDLLSLIKRFRMRDLQAVFFDGRKAEQVYMQKAYPTLPAELQNSLHFQYLPSSSPALAALSLEEKVERWKVITEFLQ